MSASSSKRSLRAGRRGFVLPTAAVLFIVGIPICGLVIDVGAFYMIQSRLQAAVDAAALAGARALARGTNSTQQQTAAQDTAIQYVDANYPAGYMASTGLNRTAVADLTNTFFRTVTVDGSVNAPHLFMRWFGGTFTTIRAHAQATRRDVNVMIVMDRSNSLDLSGSCTPLKNAAVSFVDKFSEGRDYLGLVTYGTTYSTVVSPTQTFHTSIQNAINSMVCEGSTNSASGLWLGYQGLSSLNQPAALNVILFFTDGQPTSVAADFSIKGTSSCTNKTARLGVITADYGGSSIRGLMNVVPQSPVPTNDATPAPNSSGCAYNVSWQNNRDDVGLDVTGIPATDHFGNSLTYSYHSGVSAPSGLLPATNSPSPTNENNFVNGAENAAVHASVRIHSGVTGVGVANAIPNVVIFSIGLLNAASAVPNQAFLEYVANDPSNTTYYNSAYQPGLYVAANNASELSAAFSRVASEILRLAQ